MASSLVEVSIESLLGSLLTFLQTSSSAFIDIRIGTNSDHSPIHQLCKSRAKSAIKSLPGNQTLNTFANIRFTSLENSLTLLYPFIVLDLLLLFSSLSKARFR